MRVVVQHDPVSRRVKVYAFRDAAVGGWVLHGDQWVPTSDGVTPAPTLDLPQDVFAAIVEKGMQVVPASSVMEKAWTDAIGVRDRLLTIIEGSQNHA